MAWRKRIPTSDDLELARTIMSENFRPYWRQFSKGFACLAVVSGTTASMAWLLGDVINKIFVDKNEGLLWILSASLFLIFAVKGAATYFQSVIFARVGNSIVAENQKRVYAHILNMNLEFFTNTSSSDIITRVSHGAQAAREVVELVVQSLGRDLLTLIGLLIVMFLKAPFMAALTILIAPAAIYGLTNLTKRVRAFVRQEMLSMAEIISALQETTHGARIIKSFALRGFMSTRMEAAIHSVEYRANKIASLQAKSAPLIDVLSGLAIALVVAIAGWQSIRYGQKPGEFMSFITALLLAYEPAKRLARVHVQLVTSLTGVRMMTDLLQTRVHPTELAQGDTGALEAETLEFRNVSFGYRENSEVLREISFKVKRGQKIALVGPTGSGKSTIFNLLQRFYDPTSGSIYLDGKDIKSLHPYSLRNHIALVSQDTFLFSGSVRENIRLGRVGARDDEVEKVAEDASAREFIEALPQQFDTSTGENGVQLSGGQRQRLAIARALLKRAPIILLDEATSALDSETEFNVQKSLSLLTSGKISFVIAHRLSTVQDASLILVIDKGEIVECGTHWELRKRSGLYQMLCDRQFINDEQPGLTVSA